VSDAIERFLAKTEERDGHLLWTGATDGGGRYGRFWFEGRAVQAHVFAFEAFVRPLVEGEEVDHVCRVSLCVRPHEAHLEAVTHAVNVERADPAGYSANARKTHCKRGHEFTDENTRVMVRRSGRYAGRAARICRDCRALRE
jgi:hypothetical protein